jgi:GH15 family glucan-1,4-alpha-glucosidase
MSSRIEDYALIGDCETAALVSKDGSIDSLCWPRFDSGACFAALVGDANNGHWQIAPAAAAGADANVRLRRHYRANTLILETEFTTAGGAVVLIDFMPLRGGQAWSHLVRLVVGKRATVPMRTELIVRFGYGGWVPWVTRSETGDLLAIAGPDMLLLRTPVELRGERLTTVGDFAVSAGQRAPFVLTYVPSHLPLPEPVDVGDALRSTEEFWQSWASACRSTDQHGEIVTRSLITLKALTYAPTGGIVADRADYLAARATGRSAQLGLPLLLAARRYADAPRADEHRILRRGEGVARLAAPSRCWKPGADPNHVRGRGRTMAGRARGPVAWRIRELETRAHRQRRRRPAPA